MNDADLFDYQGQQVVIATMHGKELAIAPTLLRELGLRVEVCAGIDTDRYGTFTREVARVGTPVETARAKIAAACQLAPDARILLASEGSFGPHPSIPFAPLGRELVLMIDRATGLEISGHDTSLDVNFAHVVAESWHQVGSFAASAGFPAHGLIVSACRDGVPAPNLWIDKEVHDAADLERSFGTALALTGAAFVETDMRAHRNPTRMRAIERATQDLVRSYRSRCPACASPGFVVVRHVSGLTCELCGRPTRMTRSTIRGCSKCGFEIGQSVSCDDRLANPANCEACNP